MPVAPAADFAGTFTTVNGGGFGPDFVLVDVVLAVAVVACVDCRGSIAWYVPVNFMYNLKTDNHVLQ